MLHIMSKMTIIESIITYFRLKVNTLKQIKI